MQLSPCPFCGGSAHFADLNTSGFIICRNCSAHGTTVYAPFTLTDPEERHEWLQETAAHWWNRRKIASKSAVKHMVDRFLGWHLPADFNPDGGVSFRPMGNAGTAHEYKNDPSGTNLLDATQAEAMVRYMIEGLPSALNA